MRIIVAALAAVLAAVPVGAQFLPQPSSARHILEGHWQSCQDPPGGAYTERVYDHVVNGVPQFEVHLGPGREFAIFKGVDELHREHTSEHNLLKPYRVPMIASRASQRWEIP